MHKLKGVEQHKTSKKYFSRVKIDGERHYLGTFNTAIEAHNEYKSFLKQHGRILVNNSTSVVSDLSSLQFNRLTVIEHCKLDRGKHTWLCQCQCGNKVIVPTAHLKNNNTKSCGCLKVDMSKKRLSIKKTEASFNKVFSYYKRNAKRRNIKFELNKDQFKEISTGKCHYCNEDPSYFFKRKTNGYFIYNGIDRKDSNEGYITSNCLPCCRICNRAKSNMSYQDYKDYLNRFIKRKENEQ